MEEKYFKGPVNLIHCRYVPKNKISHTSFPFHCLKSGQDVAVWPVNIHTWRDESSLQGSAHLVNKIHRKIIKRCGYLDDICTLFTRWFENIISLNCLSNNSNTIIVIFSNITVNYCKAISELLIAIAIKSSRILNYRGTFTKIDKNIPELCL